MGSLKPRVEAWLRRFEHKIGIDRGGRTVWVWLLPPGIGLLTAVLVPFMPGLPDAMSVAERLTLAVFGMFTMTAIAAIYLISFDNDHNQQAPIDEPPARGDDDGPEAPPAPVSPQPPQWLGALVKKPSEAERQEDAGERTTEKVPAGTLR